MDKCIRQNWPDYEEVRMIRTWRSAPLLRCSAALLSLVTLFAPGSEALHHQYWWQTGKGVGNRKLETYFHFPPGSMSSGYPALIVAFRA